MTKEEMWKEYHDITKQIRVLNCKQYRLLVDIAKFKDGDIVEVINKESNYFGMKGMISRIEYDRCSNDGIRYQLVRVLKNGTIGKNYMGWGYKEDSLKLVKAKAENE